MGRITEHVRDAQGHKWPITGYWCDACGMPLHHILRVTGVHPTCEVHDLAGREGANPDGEGGCAARTATLDTFTPPS